MSDTSRTNIQWPGWEIGQVIGQGSFGSVYEIRRDLLGEQEAAALKIISIPRSRAEIEELYSDGYSKESITATFRNHLKNILAEYSLMRKLSDCPNVVTCDDVRYIQHDDGIGWDIYIKMELLKPMMRALPPLIPEETALKLGKDLCKALVACAQHNILHRDIKPQNIFLSRSGEYKLGDFGIAKITESISGGTRIGTYKYMAPEVYNNQPYGVQADIYSLGIVMYWMLNERRVPFLPLPPQSVTAAEDERARFLRLRGEPIPAPAHGSEELKNIVLKACAYDPAQRYTSAEEMLRDLEKVTLLPPAPVISQPEPKVQIPVPVEASPTDVLKEDNRTTVLSREELPDDESTLLAEGAAPAQIPAPEQPEPEAPIPADVPEEDDLTSLLAGEEIPDDESTMLAGEEIPAPAQPEVEPALQPKPAKKTRKGLWIAAGAAAVLLCLSAWFLTRHSHDWQEATCDEPKTCLGCGETEGQPLGHSWEEASCAEPKTCLTCGETEGEPLEHSWLPATCQSPKTCELCGKTQGMLGIHSWLVATEENPRTCAVCGLTDGLAVGIPLNEFPVSDCSADLSDTSQHAVDIDAYLSYEYHSGSYRGSGSCIYLRAENSTEYVSFTGLDDYRVFTATIIPFSLDERGNIKIYGNGQLIYESDTIISPCESFDISLDITGITELRIEVSCDSHPYNFGTRLDAKVHK